MCLAIPGKIVSIKNSMAKVDVAGTIKKGSLQLVPEAKMGDYVLLHAGFAIQVIDEDEALETLRLLETISDEVYG